MIDVRWTFPHGLEKIYNRIVMPGAALNVVLALALIPGLRKMGVAWALLATEASITLTVFFVPWKMRLNPFQVASPHAPTP